MGKEVAWLSAFAKGDLLKLRFCFINSFVFVFFCFGFVFVSYG